MTKQFLITRPMHDKETAYLHSFSKEIVKLAKEDKRLRVTDLSGENANRKNVEQFLSTNDPTLAFFNGHGDDETVFGDNNMPVLDKDNIHLSKDKIIYALACNSLIKLGILAVNKKARAYIGYIDEFMWVGDPSRSAVPDKDKNSMPFRRIYHFMIYSLLSGTKVGDAIEKTKTEYQKLIKHYATSSDNFGDAPAIGLALSWDMLSLGMAGDTEAAF